MFTFDDFLHPQLSASLWAFLRTSYGVLLLGTLYGAYRHGRRYFLSERWGGYAQSLPDVDILHNPYVYHVVAAIWFAAAGCITLGRFTIAASVVNLALCYYFFVHMRWKGVLRGMGAPGFMTYWCAAATFLIEWTSRAAPDLRPTALLLIQADYAFIMLSAGLYKATAGYLQGNGMELGMFNPQWGYWHRLADRFSPKSSLLFFMNQCAWSLEVLAAVMMFIPPLRLWGGLLMVASFVVVALQIKLGLLCGMVMIGGLLFASPGTFVDAGLSALVPNVLVGDSTTLSIPPALHLLTAAGLWSYLILLPFAHAGLFYNFYARRSFAPLLQRTLERYTNALGLIIWRVFSADHTNFFIQICRAKRGCEDALETLSDFDRPRSRYRHVGECITLTSLFTTLKYYPSNNALFRERVLRYSRTVGHGSEEVLVFRYFSLRKTDRRFETVLAAEFVVDVRAQSITERPVAADLSVRATTADSPLHEGVRPGSYVALGA